jgi:hypothetical protein
MTRTKPPLNRTRRSLRGQRGFALGASQMTLALVSLAVSATAITLDDGAKRVTQQEAHLHASYLLKAGGELQTALDRAVGDNGLARNDASAVLRFERGTSQAGEVRLFDARLGYGRAPQWPVGLIVPDQAGAGAPRWSAGATDVVEVAGVDLAVCRRFNEMTQGEDPEAAPPADVATALHDHGWQQGCVAAPGATAGTWYMRAFASELCVGERCKAGDVVGAAARRMFAAPTEAVTVEAATADAPVDPVAALAACATREVAAGERDPAVVAARCTSPGAAG